MKSFIYGEAIHEPVEIGGAKLQSLPLWKIWQIFLTLLFQSKLRENERNISSYVCI